MTTRAVPFHCPYCGDEDLEPYEGELNAAAGPATGGGGWYCRACARAFKLKFLGIGVKI
ncbi:Insertion element protein [Nonomuraea candida]|uniref:Insertion element protein n=1 Tax=Nonomuraea candida TaxID=359159 RepID=UPI000A0765B1|nr:Insertion element protein [Nonomuraea candida]